MKTLGFMLFAFLLLPAGSASAQRQMEILTLQYHAVDQVLSQINPFVEPSETLSGMNSWLFIQAADANRAPIKGIFAAVYLLSHRSYKRELF